MRVLSQMSGLVSPVVKHLTKRATGGTMTEKATPAKKTVAKSEWTSGIGDIKISPHRVMTPAGTYPIRGTIWTVTDMQHSQNHIDPTGIVMCVLFIWFCFLGLIFLTMRTETWTGGVLVTVSGNGFSHSTLVNPGPKSLAWVMERVNYARTLAELPAAESN
jgi:hypothetical protein